MDVQLIAEGAAAAKSTLDLMRLAISTVRDAAGLLPSGDKKTAALKALEEAEKASRIAEAQIAKTLGYELCKCEFPPAPMLRVGYIGFGKGGPVFECPVCKQNTCDPFRWTRKVPEHP
jgi:hypothetical protein